MSAADQLLAPVPALAVATTHSPWNALAAVPVRLSVDIPLPPMSLRTLAALRPGHILKSSVPTSDDLLVTVGGAPVCQARFEFMDGMMALRMTRLVGAPRTTA